MSLKVMRKLYDWVLHWAHTPYGAIALFILSFAESSFFPIPPDVLLIALCVGKPKKSFYFAAICSVASVLGGIFGYTLGWGFWSVVQDLFFNYIPGFTQTNFDLIRQKYELYNFWVVFTAGFTPIPYKIITISAGVFKINFFMFLIASIISRSARFFIVSTLIWKFGEKIKGFIDKYFNILSLGFVVLLILGFVVIKFFLN